VGGLASSAICNEERALWRIFDDRDSEELSRQCCCDLLRGTGYKRELRADLHSGVLDALKRHERSGFSMRPLQISQATMQVRYGGLQDRRGTSYALGACRGVTEVDWIVQTMRLFSFLVPCPVKLFSSSESAQRMPGLSAAVERRTGANSRVSQRLWKRTEMNRTTEKLHGIGQSICLITSHIVCSRVEHC